MLLEEYIVERSDVNHQGRFGKVLVLLPYLQSIASSVIRQIQNAEYYGVTEVDHLIQEMLLSCKQENVDVEEIKEEIDTELPWQNCH